MRLAAKELRQKFKAAEATKLATRGAIKAQRETGDAARTKYLEGSKEEKIRGPCHLSVRRAKNDLDNPRAASQGENIQADGFAAMRAKNL